MHEFSFEEQLALGKEGEEKVFNYLNNLESTIEVIDCSEHKLFQTFGVDGFLVTDTESGQFSGIFFDVKTDYQYCHTGKLFIEIMADADMNKKGGILSTKANVFYYYDPLGGHLFTLPVYAMRLWYDREGMRMNHKEIPNQYGQKTTGVLISPDDLEDEGVHITRDEIGTIKYA